MVDILFMKKYEYKYKTVESYDADLTLTQLNKHGENGWIVLEQIVPFVRRDYLFVKEIEET
jgi:hypothetical protein